MIALRVLERVERGSAYADLALHAALGRSGLSARDRALVTELVYGTLRWRGRLDHLLSHVLARELSKLQPAVTTILRLGAYQIVFSDRIPASAAVDESVSCARASGLARATGLVNAALRRLAREHADIPIPPLESDPLGHLVHGLSLPRWVAKRWLELFGVQDAAALAGASNNVPPLAVRTNRLRVTPEQLLAELKTRFPDARPGRLVPGAIVLERHGSAGQDLAFREGRFTIQDEASQLVVELLDPQPGEHVLEPCGAPGTKATAIAERVGFDGTVLALDKSSRRLDLVSRDARRLGLRQLGSQTADATKRLPVHPPGAGFDRVLVDAPCSGLGTLRRNPDLRWRIRPGDPRQLAEIQSRILDRASRVLRPGGTLVYSTCTVLPEENEEVVKAFLQRRSEFRLMTSDELPERVRGLADAEGFLRTAPHRHDTDAFFCARLERKP